MFYVDEQYYAGLYVVLNPQDSPDHNYLSLHKWQPEKNSRSKTPLGQSETWFECFGESARNVCRWVIMGWNPLALFRAPC